VSKRGCFEKLQMTPTAHPLMPKEASFGLPELQHIEIKKRRALSD
jgi:hypothetical protein